MTDAMTPPDTLRLSRDPYAPIVIERDGRLLYRIDIESGHASFHRDFPVDSDALRVLAARGEVRGVVFDGLRYDTGDRLSYLKAVVSLAARRDDLGPALREWLRSLVEGDFADLA